MASVRLPRIHRKWLALAFASCAIIGAVVAEDQRGTKATPSQPKRHIRNMGAIYLDITTDKTGVVSRVDFLNKIPDYVQEKIRKEIMGKHFGIPNHTYRRHVEYTWYETK
jgi:hypothetical protein